MQLQYISGERVQTIIGIAENRAKQRKSGGGISLDSGGDVEELIRAATTSEPGEPELRQALSDFTYKELVELHALAIIGRGDNGTERSDWDGLISDKLDHRDEHLASYLAAMNPLGRYLTAGLGWVRTQP